MLTTLKINDAYVLKGAPLRFDDFTGDHPATRHVTEHPALVLAMAAEILALRDLLARINGDDQP